ncbi:MAG: hypothetical protein ACOYIE_04875 [Agathobaculum sp.]|jgi:hypothetical protein|uniref:hypothetical protein n=1 Tax=Agathobaculum sp. TaxID=2048138 RepID=UPI003D8C6152
MKELKEYLREGEKVRWQGKPEAFPLMENASKGGILRTWLLTIVIISGILLAYTSSNDNWSKGFVGAMVIAGIALLCSPLMQKSKICKQKYYITDQRVIVEMNENERHSMELKDIDAIDVIHDAADQDCIVIGSCMLGKTRKQMRWLACHPRINMVDNDKKGQAEGLALYGISNAAAAMELLEEGAAGCVA